MPSYVIAPAAGIVLRGNETQQFTANEPTTWEVNKGAISAGGLYTAPNRTCTDTLLATSQTSGQTANATIAVTGVLSFDPTNGSEGATRRNVRASDGVHLRRWTERRSPALRFLKLNFSDRATAELDDVLGLWSANYPDLPLYWFDRFFNQERKYLFDGPVTYTRVGPHAYNYKLSLREVALYVPGAGTPVSSVFPYVASYGQEIERGREVLQSDADDWSRVARAEAGTDKRRFEIVFYDRAPAEVLGAESFWKYYYPNKTLQLHAGQGISGNFKIDSELAWTYQPGGLADYRFTVREA